MKKTYRMGVMTLLSLGVAFWSMTGRAKQDLQDPQEGVATKAAEKIDEVVARSSEDFSTRRSRSGKG